MKVYSTLFSLHFLVLALLFASCKEEHFITDSLYIRLVEQDFANKQKQLPHGNLFAIFQQKLTTYEREALQFLYAYMPEGDITDYPGEYWLENVRLARQAQAEMPWGREIPEEVFRHFVLPVRVNNENLDDARRTFYPLLKQRIAGLNSYDAVLEINRWCHEKVGYTPSDARTSSPLASVRSAYGRCGESSTFTVAALRAVGIPARQIYTPRWAHSDDNHAWVEAWVEGKWYFLGAAEPEPVLNLGWFNAVASRAMLIHTKVFGRYKGPEEVMQQHPLYTEINLIEHYAESSKLFVTVKDREGKPIENAKVEFKVYNYAEFYTVGTRYTNREGKTSLSAGHGDMLVWASRGSDFGYIKVSFGQKEQVEIVLDKSEKENYSLPIDMVPPAERPNIPTVSPDQRAENEQRMKQGDSIRSAYINTFMDMKSAETFAARHGLPHEVTPLLVAARGNWEVLSRFLVEANIKGETQKATNLLSVLSKKDLRDVSMPVLEDHLQHSLQENTDTLLFNTCVLNPRVGYEMIHPYKAYFRQKFSEADCQAFCNNPQLLMEWFKKRIKVKEELNLPGLIISPQGVWEARVADRRSFAVCFVSLARSLGIPMWIDQTTGKIQHRKQSDKEVLDIDFEREELRQAPTGRLILNYSPVAGIKAPQYYRHFTLSKFREGAFQLLNYDDNEIDMGGETEWNHFTKNGIQLDAGYYMLTSGIRQSDGSVPAQLSFFEVRKDETIQVKLLLREQFQEERKNRGNIPIHLQYLPMGETQMRSITSFGESGQGDCYIVAFLAPGQEPTTHALRDIAARGDEFTAICRPILFLFTEHEQSKKFHPADYPGLPSSIAYGIDKQGSALKQIATSLGLHSDTQLPVVLLVHTSGEVRYYVQGYTIGVGDLLLKEMHMLP